MASGGAHTVRDQLAQAEQQCRATMERAFDLTESKDHIVSRGGGVSAHTEREREREGSEEEGGQRLRQERERERVCVCGCDCYKRWEKGGGKERKGREKGRKR